MKVFSNNHPQSSGTHARAVARKGFSLVEIMTAAIIGTGVVLMMALALRVGTEGFDEANQRIDVLVEARAALSALADDAATIVGIDGDEFGWVDNNERFHEIYFLTLKPSDAQNSAEAVGDVCYVHYFTAITQDAPVTEAAFSRKLYRRFLSSGDIVGALSSGELPTPNADPEQAEAVAFNVTRFTVQPLSASAGEGSPLLPLDGNDGLPEALEVDFQVVDSDTARLLTTEADWNLNTDIARSLIIESSDVTESIRGRNFHLNLEIGHDN